MRRNMLHLTCDRCRLTDEHLSLAHAQVEGWSQLIVLKAGAASDSDHRWQMEICPSCATSLAEWAEEEVAS